MSTEKHPEVTEKESLDLIHRYPLAGAERVEAGIMDLAAVHRAAPDEEEKRSRSGPEGRARWPSASGS